MIGGRPATAVSLGPTVLAIALFVAIDSMVPEDASPRT
jgi:hypothetical protein